jgi:hypothetical protein
MYRFALLLADASFDVEAIHLHFTIAAHLTCSAAANRQGDAPFPCCISVSALANRSVPLGAENFSSALRPIDLFVRILSLGLSHQMPPTMTTHH